MNEGLHKKIEETLNSLDGMQRAEANPFLYGKLRNRMEDVKKFVPRQLAWRMVIALAIVAVINIASILHFTSEKQKGNGAELVAKEYSISLPQTY
jgi:hypothetical protein